MGCVYDAPRPYPTLLCRGWRWTKEGQYWIAFRPLLAVIEQLEATGAHFRSLHDPIDTTTPQGMFSLQVLGAVARLERALIAERTKAGLRTARSQGRTGAQNVCLR